MSNILKELKGELVKAITFLKEGKESFAETLTPESVQITGDFKPGSKIEKIDSDGGLSPLPDGEYTLDGKTFTVKDSFITSIDGEDAPTGEELENENPESEENPDSDLAAKVQALENEVEGIKEILGQIITQISESVKQEEMEKFSADIKALNETILKLAKIPVKESKTNTSAKVKANKDEKTLEFIKAVQSIRK